jgi:hypothetical protein
MIDAHSPFFFDNNSNEDTDNNLEHVDDEPDDCVKDLSEDEEELGEPIPLQHTISMKQRLNNEDIAVKVKSTLSFMKQQDINLPIFLNVLSWGVLGCHSDPKVQYTRTSLTISNELLGILRQ